MMTRKQIDAAREARLWIGQIVIPAIGLAVTAFGVPAVRNAVAAKVENIKESIKHKKENKQNVIEFKKVTRG